MTSTSAPTGGLDLERRVVVVAHACAAVAAACTALWPGWAGLDRTPLLVLALVGLLAAAFFAFAPSMVRIAPRFSVVVSTALTTAAVFFAEGTPATGAFVLLYAVGAAHTAFLPTRRTVALHTALPFLALPAALWANGHPEEIGGWLAALPVVTLVPTLLVRTVLRAAHRRAVRDDVLDLPNRAGLIERCAEVLRRTPTGETGWTVNVVTFEDLPELRLALGGAAADVVLAESAHRLSTLNGAVVARLGLDTLAVVRPVTTGGAGGSLATGRQEGIALLSTLLDPVGLTGRGLGRGLQVRPEASVGVTCVPDHGRDLEELLAAADVALVTARTTPSRVAVAEGEAALDVDALALHTELPAAIIDGQLRVFYQPLVAAGTHRMIGVEALVRWQHPERGLLGPGAFVPLAERSQTIVGLTHWVLRTAVAQCAAWREAGHDIGVSVNLSANVLTEPSLVEVVRTVLAEHRLERGRLTLEVTESALLADPAGAAAVLAALRQAGARVSLDDFGTGYTSLTMLRQLEVDELKIDRSFVAAAPQAPADAAIVRALVDLAHRLSMEVVAEGVEDARTADLIRSMGADVLQGYHFARPVPAAQVFTLLPEPPVDYQAPATVGPARAPRLVDEDERARLAHQVLDKTAGAQALLRRVTALTAAVVGAEFASFNVVTEEHVHLLGGHGHEFTRVPRDGTPCAWTVFAHDVVELDCELDPRLSGGEVAASGIRHYVGVPVVDGHGRTLGVLCAYDRLPLTVGEDHRHQLQVLAGVVADHLEGVDAAGLLDRVHVLLQSMAAAERAADDEQRTGLFARAVHDLVRPDFSVLVRPASPAGDRWEVAGFHGDATASTFEGVVYDAGGRSAVARAISTGRPVWVPDVATSSVVDVDLARRFGARAVFVVPVVGADGVRYVVSQSWRATQHELPAVLRDAAVAAAARTARRLSVTVPAAPRASEPAAPRATEPAAGPAAEPAAGPAAEPAALQGVR